MISNSCIEIQTSSEHRPSVPAWFAEVVIIARHLKTKGLLDTFEQQVRLVRGRFGSYEPIDFLALLIGYAISGERTLADFFASVAPFEMAFMALFGRTDLPHRSSLSRFLADVDRPCLEAFRTLFHTHGLADGWTLETIGGLWDRQGRRFLVFDIDATRQAARQRALPCDPALPPAQRRLDAVCAPGYCGRKRGEVVRTRTTALQIHTRQWVGTYAGRGNGDYRRELSSALQAINTYLTHFALLPEVALVRLDGQYGDAAVIAQIIVAGVYLITRGRGYQFLEHPQIQAVLALPPTASVTRMNTGELVELFEGGWLALGQGLPFIRVIVARHLAPPPDKLVKVGKLVGKWVYELFLTTVEAEGFLVEDILDLYHGRGAFEAVLADEDVEEDPDRWCSYTECGQELWQIAWKSGVEPTPLAWPCDARRGNTRDRVGSTETTSSAALRFRRHERYVWPLAVGQRRRSRPDWGKCFYHARRWNLALSSRRDALVQRIAAGERLYAASGFPCLDGGLPEMHAPRAVSEARRQRKPSASAQRGSSSLTHPCHG
jgi:hypothetical protein